MNAPKIMVFHPTVEEFKDFPRYIHYMESQGAHLAGVAKVVPPKEWSPCQNYDNIDNFVIPAPIEQVVSGQKGLFTQYNIQRKPITVKEFRRLTNTPRYEPPFHESYSELERVYWKNITFNSAIYGADISGSLYDKNVDVWNVAKLNTLLDVIERDSGVKIEGVNTAYLYFGMWKTTFAWHTEDMDLYSINYVHFGAPKSWYAIPPEHGKRLERLAAGFYPNDKTNCSSFLRHKMTLISPSILRQYGIPVNKITQEAGEFMITFPYGYHAGFNHGFNCAESTNFASERWINYGKAAEKCTCRNDTVTIDMDLFVQLFQPTEYELWKQKKHETKLWYGEIPFPPDMTAPYPSWKERVEEFGKICNPSLIEKVAKCGSHKISSKTNSRGSKPLSKSPRKHKKQKDQKSALPIVKLRQVIRKVDCTPIVRGKKKDQGLPSTSSQGSLSPSGKQLLELSAALTKEEQCLFDRVKSGTRRKSSAKAIASEDDAERMLNKHSITDSSLSPVASSFADDMKKPLSAQEPVIATPTCSVHCEPLSILPFEVVTKEPLVVKEPTPPVKPNLKRRHPVSKKSSKKICPDVLVKYGHTSGETLAPSVKGEIKSCKSKQESSKASFKDELEYNEKMAKHPPHCAICSLFKPYHSAPQTDLASISGLPTCIPPATPGRPSYVAGDGTTPLIPEVSFASNVNIPSPLAECQLLDEDGKSLLIQCCVCRVQVHASCYGVKDVPQSVTSSDENKTTTPWTCHRCKEKNWVAKCSLCCNRGGALKKISGGSNWAHIVCAIAIPEIYFEDTVHRNGINISKLPAKRLRLKCVYNKKSHRCSGVCLQCCSGRCTVSFHATCAHAAGIPIEPGNWPFPVYVHCHKHTMLRIKGKEESQHPVEVNRYVIAKHKNGKYYHAVVKKLKKEDFYKVNFKDNSWSDNLYSQDIVSHDWSSGEPPTVGSVVEVKWTDGGIYEAEYKGHSVQESIQVEFEDGLLVECERHEIFTEDDPMPSRIRRKLKNSNPEKSCT